MTVHHPILARLALIIAAHENHCSLCLCDQSSICFTSSALMKLCLFRNIFSIETTLSGESMLMLGIFDNIHRINHLVQGS